MNRKIVKNVSQKILKQKVENHLVLNQGVIMKEEKSIGIKKIHQSIILYQMMKAVVMQVNKVKKREELVNQHGKRL